VLEAGKKISVGGREEKDFLGQGDARFRVVRRIASGPEIRLEEQMRTQ
jgi:hypothetical protein